MNQNNTNSDFFGKDGVTSFIGIVEDVEDPKMAGRVKVRCVGWHPAEKTGEDGLSTEDLPWARVGAPTTHAQQNRIGGKHGLLVGSWVYGIFLDGEDANQPFVLASFPMTAKATDKNLKQMGSGEATAEESEDAFGRYIQNQNHPNIGLVTAKETGQTNFSDTNDPQGDGFVSDADGPCGGEKAMQSAASARRQSEMKKNETGNAEGQIYEVSKADGRCGPLAHATQDAKRKLKEMIPSPVSRLLYNDIVYNKFTGDFINFAGILASLALDLSSLFKFSANVVKAELEKRVNRNAKALAILAIPDRDFAQLGPRQLADIATTLSSDAMHAIFQEGLVDILAPLIMELLQAMLSGGGSGGSDDGQDDNGKISDFAAECLSEQLVTNIFNMVEDALEEATSGAANESGGGDTLGAISSIVGALVQGMQFVLMDEYAFHPLVFNMLGNRSQDIKNKILGCLPDRIFNTSLGSLPSFGGGGGGGDVDWTQVGFGGNSVEQGESTNIPCEDATVPKVPAPSYTPKPDGGYDPPVFPSDDVEYVPNGSQAEVVALPLPSSEDLCAKNFVEGRPNTIVVTNPGKDYYVNNRRGDKFVFPEIYIPGYQGRPVPVVDKYSGELVSIVTTCSSWGDTPNPQVTIIPSTSEIGISTSDPDYDLVLSGFHIANTGFEYCDPTIQIYDKDARVTTNGEAVPILRDGRIVDVIVINNGSGFLRAPEIRIFDNGNKCGTIGGHGAVLYPIMSVVPVDNSRPQPDPVEVIYCPAKNFKNLY